MPHFTIQLQPGVGPVLVVYVGVSNPRYSALVAAGQTPPTPLPISFLVDTGASHSSVDHAAIAPLGLTPTGSVGVHTPSTGAVPVEQPLYDVSMYIHHDESPKFMALLPVTAADFSQQPIKGLLGRDFLESCLMVYDGRSKIYSIAF